MSPLAERMRPTRLQDFVGQQHLTGAEGIIRKIIEKGSLPSMIFWGPPGVGKTTLANIIALETGRAFYTLSAVSAGVKEVREIIEKAKTASGAVLFIDEIHRFNKGQQDALLGAVENGTIVLMGATTENPSFEVNSALLSRCQVYTLKPLSEEDLLQLVNRAIGEDEILKNKKISITEHRALFTLAGGDARKVLNLLELTAATGEAITDLAVTKAAHQRMALYDKKGDQHYDIISAFIKAIRGSDPNAAVYYLARMIEGGEEVKFIARRLVISASEDIGNANPTALVLATAAFQAVNVIGYPESRIILSQCATYLACSPKSNASYLAIEKALGEVRRSGDAPVPLAIRNAPTSLMKGMDYGKGYQYAHDYVNNFAAMEFLPEELRGTVFYNPGKNPREEEMRQYLKKLWKEKYGY